MHHHKEAVRAVQIGEGADIVSGPVTDKCILMWFWVFVSKVGLPQRIADLST